MGTYLKTWKCRLNTYKTKYRPFWVHSDVHPLGIPNRHNQTRGSMRHTSPNLGDLRFKTCVHEIRGMIVRVSRTYLHLTNCCRICNNECLCYFLMLETCTCRDFTRYIIKMCLEEFALSNLHKNVILKLSVKELIYMLVGNTDHDF